MKENSKASVPITDSVSTSDSTSSAHHSMPYPSSPSSMARLTVVRENIQGELPEEYKEMMEMA